MNWHPDIAFNMSSDACEGFRLEAIKAGLSEPSYFRAKSAQLIRLMSPRFSMGGPVLHRRFSVAIPAETLQGLEELCSDLGVPFSMAGELVATALSVELPNKQ